MQYTRMQRIQTVILWRRRRRQAGREQEGEEEEERLEYSVGKLSGVLAGESPYPSPDWVSGCTEAL